MKASEQSIVEFLSLNKVQFVIPVYQRNYDWKAIQCKQLFDDIVEIGGNNDIKHHFLGSIVYLHDGPSTSANVKDFTIIDGQQRLTTITLLFLALYRFAKEYISDPSISEEIFETILSNKYSKDKEKLKLKQNGKNGLAYQHLFNNSDPADFQNYSRVIENFSYFVQLIDTTNFQTIKNGIDKLMFVEVALERGKDNPQRIFESLNSTGLALDQADLIRNYILMELTPEVQEEYYLQYWHEIETLAFDNSNEESKVSDFIRDYLTLKFLKIPSKKKVYEEFKDQFSKDKILDVLADLKKYARYYNKLINPNKEQIKDLRIHLQHIQNLEVGVSFPFLLQVFDDFANDIIDSETFKRVLELIQSFIIRRAIIGLPTNALNKIFMSLTRKIDHNNYLLSIQRALSSGYLNQRFPTDDEIKGELRVKDLYSMKQKNKSYIFNRLENFENNEKVSLTESNITIEHIFPQKPKPWESSLSSKELEEMINRRNTIANLTWTGSNSIMGNKPFIEKRDMPSYGFKASRLWVNKFLSDLDRWDIDTLDRRLEVMSTRFIQIWSYPTIAPKSTIKEDALANEIEISLMEIDFIPKGKLLAFIFRNERIEPNSFTNCYQLVISAIFQYEEIKFRNSEAASIVKLSKNPIINIAAFDIGAGNYIEGNLNKLQMVNNLKEILPIFDLDEDLDLIFSSK